MKKSIAGLLLPILLFVVPASLAAPILTGTYNGVVVFDRWGGCILCDGTDLMYVSEKVERRLLPYRGQTVQLRVTRIYQPSNPGEGMIADFSHVAVNPDSSFRPFTTGLVLRTCLGAGDRTIVLEVTNTGRHSLRVDSSRLAPTLLRRRTPGDGTFGPYDGPSYDLLSRTSLWDAENDPSWWRFGGTRRGHFEGWRMSQLTPPPHAFVLQPRQTRQIRLLCTFPAGEYDFFGGYGADFSEGTCVVSNLTAFNVSASGQLAGVTPRE